MTSLIMPPTPNARAVPGTHHDVTSVSSEPPPMDDLGLTSVSPRRLTNTRFVALFLVAVVVVAAAFLARWIPKQRQRLALASDAQAALTSQLRVRVVHPQLAESNPTRVLPGTVQPLQETNVSPRASGYVRHWYRDIGDRVKSGDELAVIDTPELDQQLIQARAQLEQARAGLQQAEANNQFALSDLQRFEKLVPAGVASQQELERGRAQAGVDAANVRVAEANVKAQQANIERLTELKAFAKVLAPFEGIVTSRSVEVGTLVTAGNPSPLFKVTATDPVRVFVQVPQDLAAAVRSGTMATVRVREYPGRDFAGRITRAAGALDAATRTMNTEIRVANPDNALLSGMYVEVSLQLPTAHRRFSIPATALVNDSAGLRVAVVGQGDRIHLVPVTIEKDNGSTIEIATGLDEQTRIVSVVSADIAEGRPVVVTNL